MHGEDLPGRRFYKSPDFTRQTNSLNAWAEVDALKQRLATEPLAGEVIKKSGGLRKIRMPLPGRGAQGGARVIYFQIVAPATILLLTIYAKNDKEDLDDDDLTALVHMRLVMCHELNLPT